MAVMMYLEAVGGLALVLALGFALRIPFAAIPEKNNSDQWGVLTKIQKHVGLRWVDYSMPDAIPSGIFPYPMLVHFIISRFPEKRWKMINVFINQLSDLVVAALVFLMILFSGATFEGWADLAWMGALLFVSLPVLMPITDRMRAHNGRCFGMMLNAVYLLALYSIIQHGSYWAWAAAIVLLLGIFIVSFFAMQTAVFFTIGLSIWYLDPAPLLLLLGTIAISFIFPSIGARDTLFFKVNHFIWYWNNYQKNTTATGRNLFKNVWRFFRVLGKDRTESLHLMYRTSPLLIAVYSVPCFWVLAGILAFSPAARLPFSGGFGEFCLAIVVICTVIFLLTSTGNLVIFGESERYFEYAAPYLCVAFIMAIQSAGFAADKLTLGLVALNVSIILFNDTVYTKRVFRMLREPSTDTAENARDVVEFLGTQPGEEVRVATIPIKLPILLRAHNQKPEKVRFYYRFIQQGLQLDAFRYFDEDIVDLNVFQSVPSNLKRKYGITHILCQKTYLKKGRFEFIDALMASTPIYQNEDYAVFEVE